MKWKKKRIISFTLFCVFILNYLIIANTPLITSKLYLLEGSISKSLHIFGNHTGYIYKTGINTKLQKIQSYFQCDNITENVNSVLCYRGNLNTTDLLSLPEPIPFWENYTNPCFYDEKGKAQCFPYLFCLSPQKSGTCDLFNMLQKHKYIVKGHKKEPQFWDRGGHHNYTPNYAHNPDTISDYLDLFNDTVDIIQNVTDPQNPFHHPTITLDFSATTLYDMIMWKYWPGNFDKNEPQVGPPHFIKHVLPGTKFVAMLRNPIDRLYSDWCFFYDKTGELPELFHEKVVQAMEWFNNCTRSRQPYRVCLFSDTENSSFDKPLKMWPETEWNPVIRLRIGLYSDFITEWFNVFSHENFYFTTLERYSKHRTKVVNEIFSFLGLETMSDFNITSGKINENINKTKPMMTRTRDILRKFYMPHNVKLAELLKDDIYLWNSTSFDDD